MTRLMTCEKNIFFKQSDHVKNNMLILLKKGYLFPFRFQTPRGRNKNSGMRPKWGALFFIEKQVFYYNRL